MSPLWNFPLLYSKVNYPKRRFSAGNTGSAVSTPADETICYDETDHCQAPQKLLYLDAPVFFLGTESSVMHWLHSVLNSKKRVLR